MEKADWKRLFGFLIIVFGVVGPVTYVAYRYAKVEDSVRRAESEMAMRGTLTDNSDREVRSWLDRFGGNVGSEEIVFAIGFGVLGVGSGAGLIITSYAAKPSKTSDDRRTPGYFGG